MISAIPDFETAVVVAVYSESQVHSSPYVPPTPPVIRRPPSAGQKPMSRGRSLSRPTEIDPGHQTRDRRGAVFEDLARPSHDQSAKDSEIPRREPTLPSFLDLPRVGVGMTRPSQEGAGLGSSPRDPLDSAIRCGPSRRVGPGSNPGGPFRKPRRLWRSS